MVASRFTYRIKSGLVSKATIQADGTSVLSSFSRASDQPVNIDWAIAEYPRIQEFAIRRPLLNAGLSAQGYASFTLVVSAMTPGMMDYWNDTFLATTAQYGNVTVQVPDKRYIASAQTRVYQAVMYRPDESEYTWIKGFIPLALNVPYRLVKCVEQV